jgi:ZIP family zinc transporter
MRLVDTSLGFSAGVMLYVAFVELLKPSADTVGPHFLAGFLLGVLAVHAVDLLVPHDHMVGEVVLDGFGSRVRASLLLAIAVVIHNLPEGLAIGSATAVERSLGTRVTLAIGIQDIPEGLAVALPFIAVGRRGLALLFAVASGLSEAAMALLPPLLGGLAPQLLPHLLSLSAGAMIYVVSHEVIPETHNHGYEREATVGLLAGVALAPLLETLVT